MLEDGTGSIASDALGFQVRILDACLYDVITFDTRLKNIDYAVSASGAPFVPKAPTFSHTYALCPVACYLTMEGGSAISSTVSRGLGLSLTFTDQPRITIATSDKYWVGYTDRF